MPCGFEKTTAIPVWAWRFMVGDGEHSFFNVLIAEGLAKVYLLLWGQDLALY